MAYTHQVNLSFLMLVSRANTPVCLKIYRLDGWLRGRMNGWVSRRTDGLDQLMDGWMHGG